MSCILTDWPVGAHGYGWQTDGTIRYAHRVAWEVEHGPIPDGMIIMHICDNRACVNLKHLKLGTHKDNQQDSINKGRHSIQNPEHVKRMKENLVEWNASEENMNNLSKARLKYVKMYGNPETKRRYNV